MTEEKQGLLKNTCASEEETEKYLNSVGHGSLQAEAKAICKILFDVPYYFCGNCKSMLDMYTTRANYCSKCGKKIKWQW